LIFSSDRTNAAPSSATAPWMTICGRACATDEAMASKLVVLGS